MPPQPKPYSKCDWPNPKPGTKTALAVAMLSRPEGATTSQIVEAGLAGGPNSTGSLRIRLQDQYGYDVRTSGNRTSGFTFRIVGRLEFRPR